MSHVYHQWCRAFCAHKGRQTIYNKYTQIIGTECGCSVFVPWTRVCVSLYDIISRNICRVTGEFRRCQCCCSTQFFSGFYLGEAWTRNLEKNAHTPRDMRTRKLPKNGLSNAVKTGGKIMDDVDDGPNEKNTKKRKRLAVAHIFFWPGLGWLLSAARC